MLIDSECCSFWTTLCFLWCKVRLPLSKKVVFICFNESTLKMMKNYFYFILKALFVLKILRYLNFCPDFLGHVGKLLDRKAIRLTSNLMTSETGKQIIAIQIFPSILRSKNNQTIKYGQLIEYNFRS